MVRATRATRRVIISTKRRYGTRHLEAGDVIALPPRDAKILVALKQARYYDDRPAIAVPKISANVNVPPSEPPARPEHTAESSPAAELEPVAIVRRPWEQPAVRPWGSTEAALTPAESERMHVLEKARSANVPIDEKWSTRKIKNFLREQGLL